ncbi:MAG: S8 family serine peptidase [Oligoflexia bacterium]|nr:S8 family serine peptidase [Oligoflexia bacterium]
MPTAFFALPQLRFALFSLTVILGISAISPALASQAEGSRLAGGVYVRFKAKAEKDLSLRNALHARAGARLRYRSSQSPIDHVLPLLKAQVRSPSALEGLCARYRASALVEYCLPAAAPERVELSSRGSQRCYRDPKMEEQFEALIALLAAMTVDCEPIPTHGRAKIMDSLSPFWAQELIGADLAKAEVLADITALPVTYGQIEATDLQSLSERALSEPLLACRGGARNAYCDSLAKATSKDLSHGTEVANLVAHPLVGVAAKARLDAVAAGGGDDGSTENFLAATDRMLQRTTQLFCSSSPFLDDAGGKPMRERISELIARGTYFVQGAGNSYPKSRPYVAAAEGISVGSISPLGLTSRFSSEGPQIAILAPSDEFEASSYAGADTMFSGTSGAQPLVCGALANVLSILPGMKFQEAKILLEKTAIPTDNARQVPRKNGAGMVNALALVKVAQRLAPGWPESRARIAKDPSLFDFREEAAADFERGRALLEATQRPQLDRCERKRGWNLVRRAFFLDPASGEARKTMAQFYRAAGYVGNAQFLESLDGFTLERLTEHSERYTHPSHIGALARKAIEFGEAGLPLLDKALASSRPQVVEIGVHGTIRVLGPEKGNAHLLAAFIRQQNVSGQMELFDLAFEEFKLDPTAWLNACFATKAAVVISSCVSKIPGRAEELGPAALEWIERAREVNDEGVQARAAEALRKLTPPDP